MTQVPQDLHTTTPEKIIQMVRDKNYSVNIGMFESLLEYNFENHHFWLQFGLTLSLSNDCPRRCLQALRECARIDHTNPLPMMLAARLCLLELNDPDEGLRYALQAIEACNQINESSTLRCIDDVNIVEQEGELLLSKSYLLASLMHACIYEREPESVRRLQEHHEKTSLHYLQLARDYNRDDYLIHFHMALHQAQHQGSIKEAVDSCRRALQLNQHHLPSIRLLLLCLSALKLNEEALKLCDAALNEFVNDIQLLHIKCNLEQQIGDCGLENSLRTARCILKAIRSAAAKLQAQSSSSAASSSSAITTAANTPTTPVTNISTKLTKNSSSIALSGQNHSNHSETYPLQTIQTTQSHAQNQTLNQNQSKSSSNNAQTNNPPQQQQQQQSPTKQVVPQAAQAIFEPTPIMPPHMNKDLMVNELQAWLLIAEIYIKLGQLADAEACITEGSNHVAGLLSHQIIYVKGLVYKAQGNYLEAKAMFQSCLALEPRHAKALQQLAFIHHLLGKNSTAERFLKDSLEIDQGLPETWHYLGLVLLDMGQASEASDCCLNAIKLGSKTPVIPFSSISRRVLE